MKQLENLREGILEEINGAISEYGFGRYKNSLILYSKALFSVCDYLIALKDIRLPKDHTERFKILDIYFPSLSKKVSVVFRKYVDTYLKLTDKESCDGVRALVREIISERITDSEIKRLAEKI